MTIKKANKVVRMRSDPLISSQAVAVRDSARDMLYTRMVSIYALPPDGNTNDLQKLQYDSARTNVQSLESRDS
jgi:hypothetical protein